MKVEADRWNKIWKLPARVERWGNKVALLMPFVAPVSSAQQESFEVRVAVKKAANTVVKSGFVHTDLAWRHVGLCRSKGKLRAVFFDLAAMDTAKEDSLSVMLNQLGIRE